jgi:hypothetical protein
MAKINEKAVEFIFGVLNELDGEAEVRFDRQSVCLFTDLRSFLKGKKLSFNLNEL